ASFPEDSDIGTLYAEAMMVQRPWKLYSQNREPEGNTPLIVSTLERVMELDPDNPGANHLYIHAVEPSKDPARGIPAADRLATLVPGAGHLNHMPAHIYIQVNQWDKSIHQNQLAIEADDAYRELSPEQGIQYMYMSHNAHFIAFSGMMSGREAEAMAAARKMWEIIPEPVLEGVAPYVDLWMTSVYDVQKRFGRWQALLDEPAPPEYLPITTAIWRAHRAIAYAALKDFEGARREQAEFQIAMEAIPEESVFGGDPSHKILKVSEHFIEGEIYLQMEDWEMAIQHLEEAVAIEDTLSYGEPPRWLQPTRHTLGAVYQAAGQHEEAERVFRRDLELWPGNGWSLFGLQRALAAQGKTKEALDVSRLYEAAWAKADEPTTTSCKCLQEI
ncbi:MAG: tetratricopeptide repeat protein, partial [Pirellulales bacterium]|nr:tetratricopeptide repeat protein [Pirellulales bacterium]